MKRFELIPPSYKKQGIFVFASILIRAFLNFVGIAALLPILYLIVDAEKMQKVPIIVKIYNFFGFSSQQQFILFVCILVVLIIIIKSALNIILYRYQTNYMLSLYRYFSKRLFCAYHWRGLQFLKSTSTARLANEVNSICLSYVFSVMASYISFVVNLIFIVLMLISLLLCSVTATLIIVGIFLPIILGYSWFVHKYTKEYGKKENEARWKQQRLVYEAFRGYPEIEINNTFPLLADKFESGLKTISSFRRKVELITQIPESIMEISIIIALVVLVMLKVPMVIFGVFALFALRMLPAIRSLMANVLSIKNNNYTIDIIKTGCEDYNKIIDNNTAERMPFNRNIEIKNLAFCFEDDSKPVISDFSLTIKKGERIGIRGFSGSGKTTLFNLLLGFYKQQQGEILIDDVPLNESNRRQWQNIISYVPQNVFIMDTTIAENVALNNEIDEKRILDVLKMASLDDFVKSLPLGIYTQIGEAGGRLSGGQKQRIGIARALYKNSEIMFFDEATSSLDSKTEREITEAIEKLSKQNREITMIIIAHRDTSLKFCDRIIEIKQPNFY